MAAMNTRGYVAGQSLSMDFSDEQKLEVEKQSRPQPKSKPAQKTTIVDDMDFTS